MDTKNPRDITSNGLFSFDCNQKVIEIKKCSVFRCTSLVV